MTTEAILAAARTPRIRTKGKEAIANAVQQGYVLKGVAVNGQSLTGTVQALHEQLPAEFPELRVGELGAAIRQGVTHVYGNEDYLSAANILSWVRSYLASAEYREALKIDEHNRMLARASKREDIDPTEVARKREEFRRNAPTQEWNEFVKHHGTWQIRLDGYAAAIYDTLARMGKINPKAETIEAAKAQAEDEVEDARRNDYRTRSLYHATKRTTSCGNVETRTKAILLERYFEALYARGITPDFSQPKSNEQPDDLPS